MHMRSFLLGIAASILFPVASFAQSPANDFGDTEEMIAETIRSTEQKIGNEAERRVSSGYSYRIWFPMNRGGSRRCSIIAIIDDEFSESQKKLIQEALKIFVKSRGTFYRNLDAAYKANNLTQPRDPKLPFRNADFDYGPPPNRSEYYKIATAVTLSVDTHLRDGKWLPSEYRTLYIRRMHETSNKPPYVLGRANLQHYTDTGVLDISLNAAYLDSTTPFNRGKSASVWAGIIMHEILHNLGWAHPDGQKGTWIEAAGFAMDVDSKLLGLTGEVSY